MLDPARTVIEKLGGASTVAQAIGIHRTRVSNWRVPKTRGGTGGLIPSRWHRPLLDYAWSHDIALTADDLVGTHASMTALVQ